MQKLAALFITSILATPAFATWIAPVSASICTRDYNAWGQASICDCPHATRYENRIGRCVQGLPVDIEVEGTITPDLNVDGDIVGFRLAKDEEETFKLVLPRHLRETFNNPELQSAKFHIKGEVIENFDGSQIAEPTIILEDIAPLDSKYVDLLPTLPTLTTID